jgi:2-keto-myo-inositol isomerase
MQDAHRVLVGPQDRLGNVAQLKALKAAGWNGPVSYEAFAKETHELADPKAALKASMDFIAVGL